jgi:hypothetical protein
MIDKRFFTAAIVLGLGLGLASCGGYVADHWPHWAGGLPPDAPPRPGTPGYADFVAHGQTNQDAANSTAPQPPAVGAVQTSMQKPSAPPAMAAAPAAPTPAQVAAPAGARPEDPSVLRGGGLY